MFTFSNTVKTLSRDSDTKKEDGVDDFLHAQVYTYIHTNIHAYIHTYIHGY